MIQVVLKEREGSVPVWMDACNPTAEELNDLAARYHLHETSVQDCLEPLHLPKHEKLSDSTFMIVRSYDENSGAEQDSVQGMTRKLAMFLGDRFLITIHRHDSNYLESIKEQYKKAPEPYYLQIIMMEIILAAVETYHRPLEEMETQIQSFESSLLHNREDSIGWDKVFRTKCRLMVIKRLLWHTLNTVQKFVPYSSTNLSMYQDLRERIENLQFFADSLLDDLSSLLNIQLSLASNRTNEVVRVLTLFSVFFMPLNFIVGIYGMNFKYMPELDSEWGYPFAWFIMISITASIYFWFRKRKWLGP